MLRYPILYNHNQKQKNVVRRSIFYNNINKISNLVKIGEVNQMLVRSKKKQILKTRSKNNPISLDPIKKNVKIVLYHYKRLKI